jgi:hypothetical protein
MQIPSSINMWNKARCSKSGELHPRNRVMSPSRRSATKWGNRSVPATADAFLVELKKSGDARHVRPRRPP